MFCPNLKSSVQRRHVGVPLRGTNVANGNQPTHSSLEELIKLEIQVSLYRKTKSPFEPAIIFIQLFRERLSEKCTRQSPKVLQVVLSSLFFKETFKNAWHERPQTCLRVLKESNKRMFHSYTARNSVLTISQIILRDCCVRISSDKLYRNNCKQRCLAAVKPHQTKYPQ